MTLPPASTRAPLCSDSAQQIEAARRLVQQGIDAALVEHTTKLFRVWLTAEQDGRGRAAEGLRTEVAGYFHAQAIVDSWRIPACTDGALVKRPRPAP